MKKKKILSLISAVLVTGLLMTACGTPSTNPASSQASSPAAEKTNAEDAKVVYAATGGSPKPFVTADENGNLLGHNIDLVNEIFVRLPQYKLEIEKTEFTSIFAGLDSNRYQLGVNNFAMNEERKEKYDFSDPIFATRYVVVVPENSELDVTVNSFADLKGKKTVTSAGNNIATALENYNKANPDAQITVEYTKADLLVQLQEIESGKYDFALHDKPIFDEYVAQYGLKVKGIELSSELAKEVLKTPYSYILVAKGNDQLLKDINEKIKEIIADGTSKKINEKYMNEDYTPYDAVE